MTGEFTQVLARRLTRYRSRSVAPGLGVVMLLAVALTAPATAQDARVAPADSADGAPFAARLGAALGSGPIAWDRLWKPESRDVAKRLLDARSQALFDWFDVEVEAEQVQDLGAAGIATDVVVRGTATWRPNAWGVATAFWTQQMDERFESNRVVRRERWIRDPRGTHMVAREPLASLAVVEARVDVGVYPGQEALLVDCRYDVRSLADGVRHVRFLLDRRSQIYDLRVNGELVDFVRGNELGSLGLEGFSPELESSFELPRALAKGEEAVIRFRLRSPLVHMAGSGYVTSLPIQDGPFRERVWVPVFGPAGTARGESQLHLRVTYPLDAFESVAFAAPVGTAPTPGEADERLEERVAELACRGSVADLDFALLARGATLGSLPEGAGVGDVSGGDLMRFTRTPAGAQARRRDALVAPLLEASQASSQDLSSELDDLIPVDDNFLDELFDDSSQDAERGADDRQAG